MINNGRPNKIGQETGDHGSDVDACQSDPLRKHNGNDQIHGPLHQCQKFVLLEHSCRRLKVGEHDSVSLKIKLRHDPDNHRLRQCHFFSVKQDDERGQEDKKADRKQSVEPLCKETVNAEQ